MKKGAADGDLVEVAGNLKAGDMVVRRAPIMMNSEKVIRFKPARSRFVYYDDMLSRGKQRLAAMLFVLAGLIIAPAYLRAYNIIGASEIPTVLLGDTIVVNSAAYRLNAPYSDWKLFPTGTPRRGDFVYLRLRNEPRLKSAFFKRILGLPGETIELRENHVFIDGRPLPVTTLNLADFTWVPKAHPIGSVVENEDDRWITFTPGKDEHRNHAPTRLTAGQYFLLGDNRDDSFDSREFGPVTADLFLGKIVAILPTGQRAR
jgi:signal peptidase I